MTRTGRSGEPPEVWQYLGPELVDHLSRRTAPILEIERDVAHAHRREDAEHVDERLAAERPAEMDRPRRGLGVGVEIDVEGLSDGSLCGASRGRDGTAPVFDDRRLPRGGPRVRNPRVGVLGDPAERLLARSGDDERNADSPRQPSGLGVVWTRLFDDHYVCVVAADHPVRRLTLTRYLEMSHVLVAPRERPGGAVDEALAKRGLTRRVALQVPTFSLVPAVLSGTRYVATIPARMAQVLMQTHALRQLAVPIPIEGFVMSQAWHEVHRADAGHRWLREQCARAASAFVTKAG